jgi:16S rRNA (guanine966-N2)-methyltransferase
MRIVGGQFKSVRFSPPKGFTSRPTTDFAKEGLFNVLSHSRNLEEQVVADLFCGTGNITFEFLSRGSNVTSVDSNFRCVGYIKDTAKKLGVGEKSLPLKMDVQRFIKDSAMQFDIVFMDPPFDSDIYFDTIDNIFLKGLIKAKGLLVVEHHKKKDLSSHPKFSFTKKYGNITFSFFE